MSSNVIWVRFEVEIQDRHVDVPIWLGSPAHKLYLKAEESGNDEDFEEFVDYMREDIAHGIEFDVTNYEKVN